MREVLEPYRHLYVAITARLAKVTVNPASDRVWLLQDVFLAGVSGVLYYDSKKVFISNHLWVRIGIPEEVPQGCAIGEPIFFIAEVYRYQHLNARVGEWEYGLKNPIDIRSPFAKGDGRRKQQWYYGEKRK